MSSWGKKHRTTANLQSLNHLDWKGPSEAMQSHLLPRVDPVRSERCLEWWNGDTVMKTLAFIILDYFGFKYHLQSRLQ